MAFNSFGNILRLTTFGESHGTAIGGIIDGFPAGVCSWPGGCTALLNRRKPDNLTLSRSEKNQIQ